MIISCSKLTPSAVARLAVYIIAAWLFAGGKPTAIAQEPNKSNPENFSPVDRKELEKQSREINDQAGQLYLADRFKDATKLFRKSLAINRRLYPETQFPQGHPELAISLNNLGIVLDAQGELEESLLLFQQSLEMKKRLFQKSQYPRGHIDLATSLNNMGGLMGSRGQFEKARLYYQQALAMFRQLYPESEYPQGHPLLAATMENLGTFLKKRRIFHEAQGYYEQALAEKRKLFPVSKYPLGHPSLAASYLDIGKLHMATGQFSQADKFLQKALTMRSRLYPVSRYPLGHPSIATSWNELGALRNLQGKHSEAGDYYEKSLAMGSRLYRKANFPLGHPNLAVALNNLGSTLSDQGKFREARKLYEQALAMRMRLYPPSKYPRGHASLAHSLNNLGSVLEKQGELNDAGKFYAQSLAMYQRLYPLSKYPQGHPHLAIGLNNLGALLKAQGKFEQARKFLMMALEIRRRQYPESNYPKGHQDVATSLSNIGALLAEHGAYDDARKYLEQAQRMHNKLATESSHPQINREHAASLNNLGNLLHNQGKYPEAIKFYQQALDKYERLYPESVYPIGHPDLASIHFNIGLLNLAYGKHEQARRHVEKSTAMYQNWGKFFASFLSEAEALNYLAKQPHTLNGLLSLPKANVDGETCYRFIWSRRGMIQWSVAQRQRALHSIKSTEVRQSYSRYLETRRRLSRLMLAPSNADPDSSANRRKELESLTQLKEQQERELADRVPDISQFIRSSARSHRKLLDKLPNNSIVIDFYRYLHIDQDSQKPGKQGERFTPYYAAFVLQPGRPVVRVDLKNAASIDESVARWRQAIAEKKESIEAARLRRMVWQRIEDSFQSNGNKITTVYLCPDGALTGLPWAALPGREKGVLLQEYRLAVLPHAQLLLDQLTTNKKYPRGGKFLLVGDVAYDQRPGVDDLPTRQDDRTIDPPATQDNQRGDRWKTLAGTKQEVRELAGLVPEKYRQPLTGLKANTANVLAELPKARWAHLAMHGFFADAQFRSLRQMQETNFSQHSFLHTYERKTPGGRNPLTLSGLVLAGANVPREVDELGIPRGDDGILTAEAISGMNLLSLELAVLSACETGLGDVAGGEGVFGLQRAFHTAGARNVVASLWSVSDQATLALMKLFYRKLRKDKLPPIEALRQAQLYLYRNPDAIPKIAALRGIDVTDVPLPPDNLKSKNTADTKLWAAFTLSGSGR